MSEGRVLATQSVTESLTVSTTLDKIIQSISGIADLNYQISSSAGEQSKAATDAAVNVEDIKNISLTNADASEQMESSNMSLDKLAMRLQDSLAQFKI